jgi:hypothetical protein
MAGTTAVKRGAVALTLLVAGLAGCGGDDNDKSTTAASPPAKTRPSTPNLEPFLMRAGEEPGFRPGALPGAQPRKLQTLTGVEAFAKEMGLPAADVRRLRSEGFISFTAAPIRGPRNTAGVTNVALYATPEGALHSRNYDLRPAVIRAGGPAQGLRFFSVPGVPGARGWTGGNPAVANVLWVEGRCYMTLGNAGPGPLVSLLSKGARAIYKRTHGQCPESGSANAPAKALWPAPKDPLARTVAAGLKPEPKEFLIHHVHAHLDVFVDGRPIVVPAGVGINIRDPEVKKFTLPDGSKSYGGIELCKKPCISPLHTHDASGILHTESATAKPNTLGEFFTEWGVRLNASCVGPYCAPRPIAIYVDGKRYTKDPRAIELTDHKEIAIVIGSPPAQIPKTANFSQA